MTMARQLYEYYRTKIDDKCGFIRVAFMEEDPDAGLRVLRAATGDPTQRRFGAQVLGVNYGFFADLYLRAAQLVEASFRFTHCEFAFDLSIEGKRTAGADKLLAAFVSRRDNVGLRWRSFDHRYAWFQLRATPKQLDAMLKFACLTHGQPFSDKLMGRSVVMPGSEAQQGWYCTKHVATALRVLDCEMFHLTPTNTLTVDELHAMVDAADHGPAAHQISRPAAVLKHVFDPRAVDAVLSKAIEAV